MTRGQLPVELMLTDGAMAMDGGSLALRATVQDGAQVEFLLDWSIRSRREGTTQFYVNGVPVPRGSSEETGWLSLVRNAAIPKLSSSGAPEETGVSKNCVVLAEDAVKYFDAIKLGPEAAISCLATRLVSLVSSATYQEGHAPAAPQPPDDRVRSLLMEGKMVEAIRAYREAHPDVGMMAASCVVKALAAEIEQAAQQAAASDGASSLAVLGTAPRR